MSYFFLKRSVDFSRHFGRLVFRLVLDGFGWFWDGFGWFWMVLGVWDGFGVFWDGFWCVVLMLGDVKILFKMLDVFSDPTMVK